MLGCSFDFVIHLHAFFETIFRTIEPSIVNDSSQHSASDWLVDTVSSDQCGRYFHRFCDAWIGCQFDRGACRYIPRENLVRKHARISISTKQNDLMISMINIGSIFSPFIYSTVNRRFEVSWTADAKKILQWLRD